MNARWDQNGRSPSSLHAVFFSCELRLWRKTCHCPEESLRWIKSGQRRGAEMQPGFPHSLKKRERPRLKGKKKKKGKQTPTASSCYQHSHLWFESLPSWAQTGLIITVAPCWSLSVTVSAAVCKKGHRVTLRKSFIFHFLLLRLQLITILGPPFSSVPGGSRPREVILREWIMA